MRRSCAIYATGIVCAHLLIVGIALMVAQVFQTMIQERIKKVKCFLFTLFLFFFFPGVLVGSFPFLSAFKWFELEPN